MGVGSFSAVVSCLGGDGGRTPLPNLPISILIHTLRGIMVNLGRIHKKLRKFLMISSNLIKSDDKLMKEIRQFDILRNRTRRRIDEIKSH